MTTRQIRFFSLLRRELYRFWKIKRQTVAAPLLESFLYISVFGAALGSRVGNLHGVDYVVFIVPGLVLMAWAMNAYMNNASSILQQKMERAIDDQLTSPASPLELLMAFSLGGFVRGGMVSMLTLTGSALLVDVPFEHPFVLALSLALSGMFFAQLGVFTGLRAVNWDDITFIQTFLLQPLIFVGGVFYSATLLPAPFDTITKFDPIYYMIGLVRYGTIGFHEIDITLALGGLFLVTAALVALNVRLFTTGWRLRA
ncbi:MAG: type transporter [Thermoleophilia bacterium]|nr:type transporter [Thermoleophilia bacterium]